MKHFLLYLFLFSSPAIYAQTEATIHVRAEVIAPTLTISIASDVLDFGQVPSNAGTVRIDPASGERGGEAFGSHSTGGFLVSGPVGASIGVRMEPPTELHRAGEGHTSPTYTPLWAQSPTCEATQLTQIQNIRHTTATVGANGCARVQIGGTLSAEGATPGIYEGTLLVYIMQN